MPRELRKSRARKLARWGRVGIAAGTLALLAACAGNLLSRSQPRPNDIVPAVDRSAASNTAITSYLDGLQRLLVSPPAEQAEIVAAAQREYETAPTPSHQLRFALILATPNHAATDQARAQRLLRELMASPAALLPAERSLAFIEQQKVDAQLTLAVENRRLQNSAVRTQTDKSSALSKRLQTEVEENARLKRELEDAQAKLDAVSDIERSLSERKPSAETKPSAESRTP